ncbi:hypothetical protein KC340_g10202 [Hortaea werneckii]|nr:hypothetical protein KC365_g15108 [Hortaea werneckii]KAI7311293.1 hypothetical protein KC340_g10202 [Hortaea werneckii]KAI7384003.1 hypothetical protein KC328_g11020 [Hortaea werneckii]
MERQSNNEHLETDEEDGGFTMEFRIGVVEDIEAQVEEMMRLGALGYFKEARQLSQSIAPAHPRTFEVVFEQLRLMLDQGAYTDLIARAEAHPQDSCTAQQSNLIALMKAIAHASISGAEGSQPSNKSEKAQSIEPAALCVQLQQRLRDASWTLEELLKDLLLLRLWFVRRTHQSAPVTALETSIYDGLVEVVFMLLEQDQMWAAKILFQSACRHMLFAFASSGTRWNTMMDTLERIAAIDESVFEGRLAKVMMAQVLLEAAQYTSSGREPPSPEVVAVVYEIAEGLQRRFETEFAGEDYGPRSAVRRRLTTSLNQLTLPIGLGGKEEAEWTIGKIKALKIKADLHDDLAMHDVLVSFALSIGLELQRLEERYERFGKSVNPQAAKSSEFLNDRTSLLAARRRLMGLRIKSRSETTHDGM